MEYLRISWELLVTSMVFTYPTWTIIIPTLWIQSENVDIKMQVRDRHANEHTALKRLGGDLTVVKSRSMLFTLSILPLFLGNGNSCILQF